VQDMSVESLFIMNSASKHYGLAHADKDKARNLIICRKALNLIAKQ
jgi:hypothetical protein